MFGRLRTWDGGSYFRRGDPGLGYRRLCGGMGEGGSVRLLPPPTGLDPGLGGFGDEVVCRFLLRHLGLLLGFGSCFDRENQFSLR